MQKKKPLSSFNRLILPLFFCLLAGCQTTGNLTDDAGFSSRTVRKCGGAIALSGRISLNYTLSHNNRTESLHGKFTWEQDSDTAHISIFSPLGQTLAVMDILPEQAAFTASGKPPVYAASADELVFRQLGWPLPVSGMRNWLQGCAINAERQHNQADLAHPEITTLDGWHIRYISWMPSGKNELAPQRINLTHAPPDTSGVSLIHIRLIIDEWHAKN